MSTWIPEYQAQCRKCMDRGFIKADRMPADGSGWILAKDVLEKGMPCDCAAGAWFKKTQHEWRKPIPGLEGR